MKSLTGKAADKENIGVCWVLFEVRNYVLGYGSYNPFHLP
jgi:hypothetical protein